jgi:hypothetical protein
MVVLLTKRKIKEINNFGNMAKKENTFIIFGNEGVDLK